MVVYVVVATFDCAHQGNDRPRAWDELIGVFREQSSAFAALEKFEYMNIFKWQIDGSLSEGPVEKRFGGDEDLGWYRERRRIDNNGQECGSLTIHIFEQEVE